MAKVFPWRSKKTKPGGRDAEMSKVDYLRRVNIFSRLTQEEVEELGMKFKMKECVLGTVFFTPDDPTERLFILKTGHADIYRLTVNGKRLVTNHLGPGSIFGEMGLLGQTMHGEFAESTEDSLVCTATREDVLRVLKEHPDVALQLLEVIGNRLRSLEERLEYVAFSTVKKRLANFLLTNMNTSTGAINGFTHAEIGDTIGALRQTVTETLSEMQNEGLVEVGHKYIRVLNRSGVEEIMTREAA